MKLLSFLRSASVAIFCASLIVAFVALLTVATPDIFAHGLKVALGSVVVAIVSGVAMAVFDKMISDRIYRQMVQDSKND